MSELLAAMDVSGNPNKGNYGFMGIVIGTRENIESMIVNLKIEQMSIKHIKSTKTREQLASRLYFDSKESIAFCLKLDKDMIINAIMKKNAKRRLNIARSKILSIYDTLLLNHIRDEIIQFLKMHNYELHRIFFECDSDCRTFAKVTGLKYKNPGRVHVLSDVIAWANNNGVEPKGVITMDLASKISKKLNQIFK